MTKLAEQLITTFSEKKTHGAFWRLSRKTVTQQLRDRVADPFLINQGRAGLCPSAAVVYGIARRSRAEYVRMVTELFDRGRTRVSRWDLKPCRDLKSSNPMGNVPQADWIPMASIRDTENLLFDFQHDSDSGGAGPGELAAWLKKAGYTDVREDWSNLWHKSKESLSSASGLYENNYHVCLVIDANVLEGQKKGGGSNHFVVLRSAATWNPRGGSVDMKVYTWGSLQTMPKNKMDLDEFLPYYYGYVAGKY